jgi:uncharacterized protein
MDPNHAPSLPGSRWRRPGRWVVSFLPRPGTRGEHVLQERCGTAERARKFYDGQLCEQLTPRMVEFIGRMEMAFVATSDAFGECDCSFRAGSPGFVRVLDERTIAYPEFRGNGVMASLGNILENPHIGIFMADFTQDLIGLHINGDAEIITPAQMHTLDPYLPEQATHPGKRPLQWVLVTVTEAYIHCSKHIPKLIAQSRVRHWGTDNPRHKGGDYFGAVAQKRGEPETEPAPAASATPASTAAAYPATAYPATAYPATAYPATVGTATAGPAAASTAAEPLTEVR